MTATRNTRKNQANQRQGRTLKHRIVDDSVVVQIARTQCGIAAPSPTDFSFFIVSKGRPDNVARMQALFEGTDVTPTWVVSNGESGVYRYAGAEDVIEGGRLTPSRNKCLDAAAAAGKWCVQLSDDLTTTQFYDSSYDTRSKSWKKPLQKEANVRSGKARVCSLSPVGAAQLIAAFMLATKAKLGGVYPCMNPGFAFALPSVTTEQFIVGDCIVVDTRHEKKQGKGPRFDERFRLKEDYDFTAQHIQKYGAVARVNRMFVRAQHLHNPGGAVADRTARLEQASIKLLREKWPGVFTNHRKPNEVVMNWRFRTEK